MKQQEFLFFKEQKKQDRKLTVNQNLSKGFGGELNQGKRKIARPLCAKNAIHLVLKSNYKFFNPRNKKLEKFICKIAEKHSIRIYQLALNWNHIHCVLKLKNKNSYNLFIRELTSKMSSVIRRFLVETKDSLIFDLKKILSHRPFTRIVHWGKDYWRVSDYVFLNFLEANNLIKRIKMKPTCKNAKNTRSRGKKTG